MSSSTANATHAQHDLKNGMTRVDPETNVMQPASASSEDDVIYKPIATHKPTKYSLCDAPAPDEPTLTTFEQYINKIHFGAFVTLFAEFAAMVVLVALTSSGPLESNYETRVCKKKFEKIVQRNGPPLWFIVCDYAATNQKALYWLAPFLGICAIDHFCCWYFRNAFFRMIRTYRQTWRFIEYSISSTVMMIAIYFLWPVAIINEIVFIATLNFCMILFGIASEWVNQDAFLRGDRPYSFWTFGFGFVPLVAIWGVLFADLSAVDGLPNFVWGATIATFILFNCFPIAMFFQARGPLSYKNYLIGEQVFVVLSFVAKSLLAWIVFGGSLNRS
jgi:hypothetical protein